MAQRHATFENSVLCILGSVLCVRRTSGVPLLCIQCSSVVHLFHLFSTPFMHLLFFWNTPTLPFFPQWTPCLPLLCIQEALGGKQSELQVNNQVPPFIFYNAPGCSHPRLTIHYASISFKIPLLHLSFALCIWAGWLWGVQRRGPPLPSRIKVPLSIFQNLWFHFEIL